VQGEREEKEEVLPPFPLLCSVTSTLLLPPPLTDLNHLQDQLPECLSVDSEPAVFL